MQAKQIVFLLVAVAVGASVVFVIGFQAGIHIDAVDAVTNPALSKAATASAGLSHGSDSRAPEFSFFNELRTPPAPVKLRKLDSPSGNANNTPELERQAEKRREREARRKAWLAKQKRKADRPNRPLALRTVERRTNDSPTVRTIPTGQDTEDRPKVRTIEAAGADDTVRTIPTEQDRVRTVPAEQDAAPTIKVRRISRTDSADAPGSEG